MHGRRKSDGLIQVLLWVKVLALAVLYGLNIAHHARAQAQIKAMMADNLMLREKLMNEAHALRRERKKMESSNEMVFEALRRMGFVQ